MKGFLLALAIAGGLTGCATDVAQTPTALRPYAGQERLLVVRQPVTVVLSTGYTRQIKPGSRWQHVGTTTQGEVLRPVGDTFMVYGRHMHEAYLVVSAGYLVGFYLPVEGAFSPLSKAIELKTE
jgi:hypothetical protein